LETGNKFHIKFSKTFPHLTDSVALTVTEIPIHVEPIWDTLYKTCYLATLHAADCKLPKKLYFL